MENPDLNTEELLVKDVSTPLFASKGWVKFLGILMIVYGGLVALSLVGIVVAWLPIWLGILLNKAANKIEQAHYSGNKNEMIEAQKSLATYFTIYGVLALIGIIFALLFVVVAVSTGLLATLSDLGSDYY